MQIEIFGCTGAGKSSLLRQILDTHSQSREAPISNDEFLLRRMRMAWLKGPLRVIALNLLCIAICLLAWRKHQIFLRHVLSCIRQLRYHVTLLERWRILRITLRNFGSFEFVKRYAAADELVISDEGTLQIAHYFLVSVAFESRQADIELFATLVPLPPAVVYLSQPETLMIERTLQRGHKRVPPGSVELVEKFVTRAIATFGIITQQPAIRCKLLTIDGQRRVLTAAMVPQDVQLQRAYTIILPALSEVP